MLPEPKLRWGAPSRRARVSLRTLGRPHAVVKHRWAGRPSAAKKKGQAPRR